MGKGATGRNSGVNNQMVDPNAVMMQLLIDWSLIGGAVLACALYAIHWTRRRDDE